MKKLITLSFLLLILIPNAYSNTITLREKSLSNHTLFFLNIVNHKYHQSDIDKYGNFNFTIRNLTNDVESNDLILIQICDKTSFSYNIIQKNNHLDVNTYCLGIIGYFNIIKEIENLKIELNPEHTFGDQIGNQVTLRCQDKHLTFCSVILANESFKILNYQTVFIKNNLGEHIFDAIPLYNLSDGVYSLSLMASDGLNTILSIKQFYLEIVDIANPYNLPAIGNFEINESDCFFIENQQKSINLSYKPNEKKTIPIYCPEKDLQIKPQISQNFILRNIINFGNFILSFIVAFIFYLIIYLIHNPKSAKKSFTIKQLLWSVIIGILLYSFLQYIKFNI